MDTQRALTKAATAVVKAMHRHLDDELPEEIANLIKIHAIASAGSAWIPVPGAAMAGSAIAIWGMYYRINSKLGLPFHKNVVKSLASGVATNLMAYVGILAVGEGLKFIPGLGSALGAVVITAASYALTLASGYVYLRVLSRVLENSTADAVTPEDLTTAVDVVMADKKVIKDFVKSAKKSYRSAAREVTPGELDAAQSVNEEVADDDA